MSLTATITHQQKKTLLPISNNFSLHTPCCFSACGRYKYWFFQKFSLIMTESSRGRRGRARTIVVFIVSQHIMVHLLSLSGVCVNDGKPHPIWCWLTTTVSSQTVQPTFLDPNVSQKIRKTDFWHCCFLVKLRIAAEHLLLSVFFIIHTVYTLCPTLLSSCWLIPEFASACVSNFVFLSVSDYVRECIVGTGQSYRGRRSVTVSGILCQAWASPIPHEHK